MNNLYLEFNYLIDKLIGSPSGAKTKVKCYLKTTQQWGGTLGQWLALMPHSKKVLGLIPVLDLGSFCVVFCVVFVLVWVYSRYCDFLLQTKNLHFRFPYDPGLTCKRDL